MHALIGWEHGTSRNKNRGNNCSWWILSWCPHGYFIKAIKHIYHVFILYYKCLGNWKNMRKRWKSIAGPSFFFFFFWGGGGGGGVRFRGNTGGRVSLVGSFRIRFGLGPGTRLDPWFSTFYRVLPTSCELITENIDMVNMFYCLTRAVAVSAIKCN